MKIKNKRFHFDSSINEYRSTSSSDEDIDYDWAIDMYRTYCCGTVYGVYCQKCSNNFTNICNICHKDCEKEITIDDMYDRCDICGSFGTEIIYDVPENFPENIAGEFPEDIVEDFPQDAHHANEPSTIDSSYSFERIQNYIVCDECYQKYDNKMDETNNLHLRHHEQKYCNSKCTCTICGNTIATNEINQEKMILFEQYIVEQGIVNCKQLQKLINNKEEIKTLYRYEQNKFEEWLDLFQCLLQNQINCRKNIIEFYLFQ